MIGVVKGASCASAVGIIIGLLLAVVDQISHCIAVKTAAHKHVIATVVNAAVQISGTGHIGKIVVLTEMGDVDAGAAIVDAAIRYAQGAVNIIARICAGNAATGKILDMATGDDGIPGLRGALRCHCIPDKAKTVPTTNLRRPIHIL